MGVDLVKYGSIRSTGEHFTHHDTNLRALENWNRRDHSPMEDFAPILNCPSEKADLLGSVLLRAQK